MPSNFHASPLVALIATGLLTACSDTPTSVPAPNEAVPAELIRAQAYNVEQFAEVIAGIEDVHTRVVTSISAEATVSKTRAILAALEAELETNDPQRVRSGLEKAHKALAKLAGGEDAAEHLADLESVKLLVERAYLLLPGSESTGLADER